MNLQQLEPRESMRVLPAWMQLPLTLITGKPFQGQKQPLSVNAITYLAIITSTLVLGTSLGLLGVRSAHYELIPLGWALVVRNLRLLQNGVVHHCAHHNFTGDKKSDRLIGMVASIITVTQNYDHYAIGHRKHHVRKSHLTKDDQALQFLLDQLGLASGMSVRECWQRLLTSLISPIFHAQFILMRLTSCFWAASNEHKFLAYSFWLLVVGLVTYTQFWTEFSLVWLIPATLLYQCATALRLVAEHPFPSAEVMEQRDREFLHDGNMAVFIGETAPALGWHNWLIWGLKMVFWHFPIRFVVMNGDTVVHDYHHYHPGTDDWANAIWQRAEKLNQGQEIWGYLNMVNHIFKTLSQLPPNFF